MKKKHSVLLGSSCILILTLYFIFNPSGSDFFPKCILFAHTGIYCPGCGSQRALHSLLHLNIKSTFSYNALFLPAIITVGYHYSASAIQKKKQKPVKTLLHHRNAPWVILGIVLAFWLLRNLDIFPFYHLSPDA